MQLGSQLGSGRSRTNNGDMKLARAYRAVLSVGMYERIDKTTVEPHSLLRCVKRYGMLRDSERPEIIGHTAHCNYERVVSKRALRRNLPAILVVCGTDMNELLATVEADHLTETIVEMMMMGLRQIVSLKLARIHATSRHDMQQRLPQMSASLVDQSDARTAAFAQHVTEARCQFDSAGPATNNYDLMTLRSNQRRG
jgi:hypothetical protein